METAVDRTLIRGGVVLSLDPDVGDFEQADVLIEGNKIVAVQPDITAGARVIDASRMIVLPGFIDTHHHHYHEVLRNAQPDATLGEYMRDIMFRAAPCSAPRMPTSATTAPPCAPSTRAPPWSRTSRGSRTRQSTVMP